jgi:hypothetical protein
MKGSSRTFILIVFFVMTLFGFLSSANAACVASTRLIKFADSSVRMKGYSCSTNDTGQAIVEVEFDRFSEAAAGSIIEESPYEDLNVLYQNSRVLHNDVYREARGLFDTYGVKLYDQDCYMVHVTSAEGGSYGGYTGKNVSCRESRTLWYLTFPDLNDLTTKEYPESWGAKLIHNSWPSVWKYYYSDCAHSSDLLSCVMLWRYLSQTDLNNYIKDVRANEVKLGAPMVRMGKTSTTQENAFKKEDDRYFSLIDRITNGKMPADFLILVDYSPAKCGCGGGAPDGIHIRNLRMHTALIKNVSNTQIIIDSLNLGKDSSSELRPYYDAQKPVSFDSIPIDPVTLSPGDTLIIPLRLNFVPSDSVGEAFGNLPAAVRTHDLIASAPGEFITSTCGNSTIQVRKSEFGAPTRPAPRIYSYGPAVTLKGVSIGGEKVDFDRPLSNFFQVVAGSGYGSCPYVYAMDAGERQWARHGKIIDNASSPIKEMTQRLQLPGNVTRFKIAEEELELTFVHKVRLELALGDGRMISIRPRNRLRPESADHYDKIKYGTEREYDFDLPLGINPVDVVKSTLAVTGYYLRYSQAASMDDEMGK